MGIGRGAPTVVVLAPALDVHGSGRAQHPPSWVDDPVAPVPDLVHDLDPSDPTDAHARGPYSDLQLQPLIGRPALAEGGGDRDDMLLGKGSGRVLLGREPNQGEQ